MSRIRRTSALALIAGLGLTALAGCSGGGADGAQSESEACDQILPVLLDVNSELSSVDASDPDGALAALQEQVQIMEDLQPEITNETVSPVYDDMVTAMSDFTDQIAAMADDPASADMTALQEGQTELIDAGSELDSTCQAAG